MLNRDFFNKIWPVIAEQVTRHRAGADADILPLLRRLGVRRGARVLDVPCGFGRHALVLARRGFRVTGIDISADLLAQAREQARKKQLTIEFQRGDMRRLRFRSEFDLLLNLFTSFGYFGDREDQRVLDSFYRALRPGGCAVVHVINRDYIVRHYRPRGVSQLKDFRLDERVAMDWATSTIRTEWTVQFQRGSPLLERISRRGKAKAHSLKGPPRVRGVTHLRIYSCHELKTMLERAGFRRVQAFGGFRGEPVSMDNRWLLLVARR
ncbi:MAG: class I SAM-dependent methyltransferase [Candidatus Acidiferrales bacterium]